MHTTRTIAIGDIHGCLEHLKELLNLVQPGPQDTLVFLGDYIDRGPDIPGTLDFLCTIKETYPSTIFLRGNHEGMLLDVLEPGDDGHGNAYLLKNNGADTTLEQYGCSPGLISELMAPDGSRHIMQKALYEYIPEAHIAFLKSTELYYVDALHGYLFVHAGIDPRKPLDRHTHEDFLWIREPFLSHTHTLPYTVVYGHTPTRECGFLPRIEHKQKRIGIDTGAVYGGKLCALTIPGETFTFYPSMRNTL